MTVCINCGGSQTHFCVATDENRKVSAQEFTYLRCTACQLISLVNPPENLSTYYSDEYYAIPTLERLYELASRENAKMAAIKPFARGKRLLEVGPAFGVFSARAKQEGFDVDVIEQDARCCEYLTNTVGVNVLHADDPDVRLQSMPAYDVVALWHVIEHLKNPFAFFDAAVANLSEGGILALAAPNPDAAQFRWMGKAWPHLDAPRHLHLIPSEVFVERGRRQGMETVMLTTNDADAKSWNFFGWQRLLMNRLPAGLGQKCGFVAGAVLAALAAPFECGTSRGSAYTLVLRKG